MTFIQRFKVADEWMIASDKIDSALEGCKAVTAKNSKASWIAHTCCGLRSYSIDSEKNFFFSEMGFSKCYIELFLSAASRGNVYM